VIRVFGIDYIYLDLVFLAVFTVLLAVNKKKIPLLAFILGGVVIFIIDWLFWMQVFKIRTLSLPPEFLSFLPQYWAETLFMFWFSMSYGLMFAWMFLMFDKKNNRFAWTALLFGGWLSIAFLSQFLQINDNLIETVRLMKSSRIKQIIIVALGYGALFLLKYRLKKILYLFLVGCGIHFMMEFSLWISGIRPSSLDLLLVNTLVESNMGVPVLYIFWDKVLSKPKGASFKKQGQ
jgi:hypothetical protein